MLHSAVSRLRLSIISVALLGVMLAVLPATAGATVLGPNSVVVPGLLADAVGNQLAFVSTAFDTNGATAGGIQGTLLAAVYDPDPIGQTAGYDFYYQVAVTSGATAPAGLTFVAAADFGDKFTDVYYRTDDPDGGGSFTAGTASAVPIEAVRDSGSEISFTFFDAPATGSRLSNGETSRVLVIRTNVRNFGPGIVSVIGDSAPAFAPVPEPTALLLLGSGLLGLSTYAARLRRRKAQG